MVKFDIRDEVIHEDPNDAAKAMSAISNSLKLPASKRTTRNRRDRNTLNGTTTFEPSQDSRPLSEVGHQSFNFGGRGGQLLRPISEFAVPSTNGFEELPLRWQVSETVDAIVASDDKSQIQITGEMTAFVEGHCPESLLLSNNIKLSFMEEGSVTLLHNESILEKVGNDYKIIPEKLAQIKGVETTFFKYRRMSMNDQQPLPFFIKSVFQSDINEDTFDHKFALGCIPRPIVNHVNHLRLGTHLSSAGNAKAFPQPIWYPKSQELIWEGSSNSKLHVAASIYSQASRFITLSLGFDVLCSTPLLPVTLELGEQFSVTSQVKSGIVLIVSNSDLIADLDDQIVSSVYTTAYDTTIPAATKPENSSALLSVIKENEEEVNVDYESKDLELIVKSEGDESKPHAESDEEITDAKDMDVEKVDSEENFETPTGMTPVNSEINGLDLEKISYSLPEITDEETHLPDENLTNREADQLSPPNVENEEPVIIEKEDAKDSSLEEMLADEALEPTPAHKEEEMSPDSKIEKGETPKDPFSN